MKNYICDVYMWLKDKIQLKSRNEGRGVIEQNDSTWYYQDTALVLHPWLEVHVHYLGFSVIPGRIMPQFGFLCVPEEQQDSTQRSKTYLAEARLTWHKARLKLFLHILCSTSTKLRWQPPWHFSPTEENRQIEWFHY